MKMKKSIFWVVSTALLLSACATNKEALTREQKLARAHAFSNEVLAGDERQADVRVVAVYPRKYVSGKKGVFSARQLRIIRQSHSSKAVALKTVGLLLGGGYQGNDKRDLWGDSLAVSNHAHVVALPLVSSYAFREFAADDKGERFFPLEIRVKDFALVYERYGQKSDGNYFLLQDLEFFKIPENQRLRPFVFKCRRENAVHTLPEWQADNYRLIREEAEKYTQSCVDELLSKHQAQLHAAYAR